MVTRGVLLVCLAACGDSPAHVQLAPVNPCGPAHSPTGLRVIAYTGGGELRRAVPPTEIDAFPGDTEQLGVEVLGQAGAVIATGKTAPLDFANLPNGDAIPIMMIPPGGFCATPEAPHAARTGPAIARAGNGVLILGGLDGSGAPLATAEYYDAADGTFHDVAVPGAYDDPVNGLAGAVLTELHDGRVALTGTSRELRSYFDPVTRAITKIDPFDVRAFHAALETSDNQLLVMGGCAGVGSAACDGPVRHESYTYTLDQLDKPRGHAPTLPPGETRLGGRIFDLGVQTDGVRRFVLAPGDGDPGQGDRFALDDFMTEPVAGLHAQTVALDGSALLSADASGAAVILPPGGAAEAITPAPAMTAAQLVTLEDGSVLALGDQVARYVPTTNVWQTLDAPPVPLGASRALRLLDGSVFVLAGAQAFVYRPSLVGPQTGLLTAAPDGSQQGILTYPDPAALTRMNGKNLLTGDGSRALVGGPKIATGSISASVHVITGGVALIAEQQGPGDAVVGRLVPGDAATITRADGTSCAGATVTSDELALPITLAISGHSVTLATSTATKVTCDLPVEARGAWGLAAAGDNAQIDVGPVTVTRTR
ncbi:MAG: hypothetical protein JO257_15845 [Deltaproteobacteria bacterium]|nr:hypothetical protein [Deltaproteobacteria bacterium]